jgi:hypothetical protein
MAAGFGPPALTAARRSRKITAAARNALKPIMRIFLSIETPYLCSGDPSSSAAFGGLTPQD